MGYASYPPSGSGGTGTVTSVGLSAPASILSVSGSPVTTSGTLALSLVTQSANLVWAGPTTGSAANPTFRALVAADLPFAVGNLTDVGTDGITVTGGTGAVIGSGTSIAQHVADTTHNGYLSSTDWNTFNNKQAALTIGNLTDAGTDGITVTGGTGAVIGSGTSIAQHVADTTHNGYLSSADWNTFNGKQSTTLTSAHIFVGNVSNVATDVAMSGDVHIDNTGATSLVATTNATLTTISSLVSVGTITTGTWNATTIAVNHGGTGQTSLTAHDVLVGAGTSAVTLVAPSSTSGIPLVSNGSSSDPSFTTAVVAGGGTGQTSLTAHSVLVGNGTSGITQLTVPASGTVLTGVASSDPAFSATPTLGVAATTSGTLALASSTASTGLVTLANQGTTSGNAYTFSFPLTGGTNGYALTTNGSGTTTWTSVLTNPMDGGGQIIYGGAAGVPTKLANGSAGQVLQSAGGTSAPVWINMGTVNVTSQTTTYSIAATDGIVLCSGSAFTATLPTAASITGRKYTIKKTDSSLTNIITIGTTSSQTIDGLSSYALYTLNEEVTVASDGSNWQIVDHFIPSVYVSYTPTGGLTTNTTYTGFWKRIGDEVRVQWKASFSGAPNNVSITINMPTGMTIATGSLVASGNVDQIPGQFIMWHSSTGYRGHIAYSSSSAVVLKMLDGNATSGMTVVAYSITAPVTIGNGDYIEGWFQVPVSSWQG